jgi:hypothetical protein
VDPVTRFRGKVYFVIVKLFGENTAERMRRLFGRKP